MFAKENKMNRQDLLLKPIWNYHDICDYVDCKKSKAYQIMQIAKSKHNGVVKFNSQCVYRDSVLASLGIILERELYIKKLIEKGGQNGN